jgi:hypothetical protein
VHYLLAGTQDLAPRHQGTPKTTCIRHPRRGRSDDPNQMRQGKTKILIGVIRGPVLARDLGVCPPGHGQHVP